jgi:PPK2 family polyphosphate:nucleotide phosphotransferase
MRARLLAFLLLLPLGAEAAGTITPAEFHEVVFHQLAQVTSLPPLEGLAHLERLASLVTTDSPSLVPDQTSAQALLSLIATPAFRRLGDVPATRDRFAARIGPSNLPTLEGLAKGLHAMSKSDAGLYRRLAAVREAFAPSEEGKEPELSSVEERLRKFYEGSVVDAERAEPAPVQTEPPIGGPPVQRGAASGRPVAFKRDGAFELGRVDPGGTPGFSGPTRKKEARRRMLENQARLDELQKALYAEKKRGVLVVLQGMDTSGKDGTIRRVVRGLNPQGVRVQSFKVPTPDEAAHDFLWRVHPAVPARGMMAVFNRSHYEDILVPAVRGLLPKERLAERVRQVREFERYLADNGVVVVKLFLHISKTEQKKRLEARLANPEKFWKFSVEDLKARELWDKFQSTYGEILAQTSAPWARWFVVPANKKWYRDWLVSEVLVGALERLAPRFPGLPAGARKITIPD